MPHTDILYIGDSETVISRYAVGADVFAQSYFNDNGRYLRHALAGHPTIRVRHIIPANVPAEFPHTDEELAAYDVAIFSDVSNNSIVSCSSIEHTGDPAAMVV